MSASEMREPDGEWLRLQNDDDDAEIRYQSARVELYLAADHQFMTHRRMTRYAERTVLTRRSHR